MGTDEAASSVGPILIRSRRLAVSGAISAALSHVSFVSDFGSSCSHALFAKRPSYTLGSGRNTTSSPELDAPAVAAGRPACSVTVFGAKAVLGTTPSCSHLRQA